MKYTKSFAAAAALFAGPLAAQVPVTVASNNATLTNLGAVVQGQSYHLTATGQSDLYAAYSYDGHNGLTFTADGIPTYQFGGSYAPFYPNGLSYDPSSGSSCVGGSSILCGALIGTFSTTPTPADFIQLGSSYDFVAPVTGFLYGLVNDVSYYADNAATGFTVTLSPAGVTGAVPELASWAMMISGFGLAGAALRRRRAGLGLAAA